MIILIKNNATEEQMQNLSEWLTQQGYGLHISHGDGQTILGLVGDTSRLDIDLVRALDIVEDVKRIQEPYKNANRKFHPADTVIEVAGKKIGGGNFHDNRRPLLGGIRGADRRGRAGGQGRGRGHAARRRVQAPHLALRLPGAS